MANKLLIKRSSVANKVPTTTDLALGELGLNTNDGKLYLKKDDGTAAIVEVAVKNSSGNLGIGTAPSARLHVLSTTEQLRAAYDASNYVTLTVGSTGGVTLDAVGSGANFTFNDNVGIAATPSAWSSDFKTLTLGTTFGGTVWTYVPEGGTGVASNVYHDGASWKYRSNGYVALTESRAVDGAHIWYTAASGTAGSVATLYRTMQIDNSGNLGIGIASASARLHLVSTTEQLRVGYDASNYVTLTVGSTGGVTFDAVGSGAQFTFSDAVVCSSTLQATQLRGGYNDTTGSANTAAQALGTNTVSRVLISASTTLTTTVPPAGAHASVIIQTSGTVSRTVTFGTGFKSQGTLATGAVADRYWVVNFVSDGTSLYETSRTTTAYA